jgi:selenoprotein W-related protein
LAAKLLPRFKTEVTRLVMVPSKGGCFELSVGGRKLYSKLQTGQFPDDETLLAELEKVVRARTSR